MDGTQREQAGAGHWHEPSRAVVALAGGLIVIAAVVAAPQFVLASHVFAAVLFAGASCGIVAAVLSQYWTPSRVFLVLSFPLVFFAVSWLRETVGLAPHTLLVGLSAVVVAGTVTDRFVGSR